MSGARPQGLHDPREWLARVGLSERDVPHVLAAADLSRERILRARAALAAVPAPGAAAIALGSLGRHECRDGSDLDLAWIHDAALVGEGATTQHRRAAIHALREAGFDVPEKTFGGSIAIGTLLENIGGEQDTNVRLTYRALLLTESAWLLGEERAAGMRGRIFSVYRGGVTRGRFMATLLNDLLRYWRTVCVDYRYKIEEGSKGWALRYGKLRHSRKAWHLANLVLACAARTVAEGEGHDAYLEARLNLPPLLKIAAGLDALGDAQACADLWRRHDAFLGIVADPATRERLEALRPGEQDCEELDALKENAAGLDAAAEQVIELLMKRQPARGHLLRFGLL
jgi:hypothetical protein